MTKRSETLVLESTGQPRRILERMRPAFREHVRPHTKNLEGERLGGGNVLSTLWNHRGTRDVDAYVRLATTESGNDVLDRAAAACGAYRVEHPTFKRLEFERNEDNHIDVTFGTPTPRIGEKTVILDGEPTSILNTAQIMSGKLHGRGMTAPIRDLYDIGVCRIADPEALRIAVNGVPDEKLNAILTIYTKLKTQYEQDAAAIADVPEALRPIRTNPTGYARNAILESRYRSVRIRTENGKAAIDIEATGRPITRTYNDAEALLDGMEGTGINAFLIAQNRDAETVGHATIDRMWTGRTELVIEVRPPALKHRRADLPAVDWKPPTPRTAQHTDRETARR